MTDYYKKQLAQAFGSNLKVQFSSDTGKSNWLNINLDSIEAIEQLLENQKEAIINNLGYEGAERQRKHKIGLAIAMLLGVKRCVDNDTRFDTAIGNKTPIGLYETIKSLLKDNPNNSRYAELFRDYE